MGFIWIFTDNVASLLNIYKESLNLLKKLPNPKYWSKDCKNPFLLINDIIIYVLTFLNLLLEELLREVWFRMLNFQFALILFFYSFIIRYPTLYSHLYLMHFFYEEHKLFLISQTGLLDLLVDLHFYGQLLALFYAHEKLY